VQCNLTLSMSPAGCDAWSPRRRAAPRRPRVQTVDEQTLFSQGATQARVALPARGRRRLVTAPTNRIQYRCASSDSRSFSIVTWYHTTSAFAQTFQTQARASLLQLVFNSSLSSSLHLHLKSHLLLPLACEAFLQGLLLAAHGPRHHFLNHTASKLLERQPVPRVLQDHHLAIL
jgi:hypothetical protein